MGEIWRGLGKGSGVRGECGRSWDGVRECAAGGWHDECLVRGSRMVMRRAYDPRNPELRGAVGTIDLP